MHMHDKRPKSLTLNRCQLNLPFTAPKLNFKFLRHPKLSLGNRSHAHARSKTDPPLASDQPVKVHQTESKLNQGESKLIKVKIPLNLIPDLSTHDSI